MSKKSTLAVITLAALAAVMVSAAVVQYLGLIPTTGTIVSGDADFDPTAFDWGNLTIGENVTKTVNVTNSGTAPVNLTASVANISASLANFTLEWDAESLVLAPSEWVLANFTLTVYDNTDAEDFSFDIVIGDQT